MAGEAKLGPQAAEEVIDLLKQVKAGDQLDTLARKTGFEVKALEDITQKGIGKGGAKGGKDVLKSIVEKLGGTIESVQTEVNTLLGRTRDVGGGQVPPAAQPAFRKEVIEPTEKRGYTLGTPPGEAPPAVVAKPGPLSPRLQSLSDAANAAAEAQRARQAGSVIDAEFQTEGLVPVSRRAEGLFTEGEVAEMAGKARPGPAGRGVSDVTPGAKVARGEESRTQAERAADLDLGLDLGMPKIPKGAKRAGLGLGVVGLASGFSKEANAPAVIKEAGVDKIEDVKGLANKAEAQGAVTPEQKAVFVQQAEQVAKAEKSLGEILREEYKQDKARIELLRLTETIMNGLVTAIGANALLNKGSPYAVDFSKGPKTDWAGEFDRLQKDFNTQMGALNEKYKLEAAEKREAERETARESRFVRGQELDREKLEAQKAKEGQVAGQKAQEKATAAKDKAFAELSGALASLKEKSTPISTKQVVANATKLGVPKEEIDLLVSKTTGKGLFNLADENKVAEILEKYRPGQQQAAAPAEALVDMVAPDGRALKVPAARVSELEAKGARRK